MTGEEKDLLKKYLTHLNVLGKDGSHPHFEAWYQEIRYARGPAPTDRGRDGGAALQGRPGGGKAVQGLNTNATTTVQPRGAVKLGEPPGTETPDGAARSTRLTRDEWVLSPSEWKSETSTASACQTSPGG